MAFCIMKLLIYEKPTKNNKKGLSHQINYKNTKQKNLKEPKQNHYLCKDTYKKYGKKKNKYHT